MLKKLNFKKPNFLIQKLIVTFLKFLNILFKFSKTVNIKISINLVVYHEISNILIKNLFLNI